MKCIRKYSAKAKSITHTNMAIKGNGATDIKNRNNNIISTTEGTAISILVVTGRNGPPP